MAQRRGARHSRTIVPEPGTSPTIVCASHVRSRHATIVTVLSLVKYDRITIKPSQKLSIVNIVLKNLYVISCST